MTDATKKMLLKSLLFVLAIIACLTIIAFSPLREYASPANLALLKSQYTGHPALFAAGFILTGIILIAVGFPRTVFCMAAGILYDIWLGILMGQIAALGGAYITYGLGRKLARPFFQAKVARYTFLADKLSRSNPAVFVALLRQAPVPGIVSNAFCGAMEISTGYFLLGSFIGFLPQSIVFGLFGSSVQSDFMLRITIAFVLFLIIIVGLKLYFTRKFALKSA